MKLAMVTKMRGTSKATENTKQTVDNKKKAKKTVTTQKKNTKATKANTATASTLKPSRCMIKASPDNSSTSSRDRRHNLCW